MSLDLPTMRAHLLSDRGVEQVFGSNAGIRYSLVVTEHPNEDIWDSVLWLCGVEYDQIGWCLMDVLLEFPSSQKALLQPTEDR